MSEPARNRFALDLDDLERQLRGAAQPQRQGAAADPLQELTRIVGQDDPLKDVFAPRQAAPEPAPHAENVTHLAPLRAQGQAQQPPQPQEFYEPAAAPEAAPPADLRGAMDEFEALLLRRGVGGRSKRETDEDEANAPLPRDLDDPGEAAAFSGGAYAPQDTYVEPPLTAGEDMRAYQPRRSRKGLWTAGALVGVVAVGVASAMAFRETTTRPSGEPPVIAADQGPMKVAPDNPGGAEIPNQNKQIYERSGDTPPGKAKVVNTEEQPVDVEQAARLAQPRVVLAGPGTGPAGDAAAGATPGGSAISATNPAGMLPVSPVPGLGEPRRVRTVSIRPDGTPANLPVAQPTAPPHVATTGSAPAARPAETRQRIAAAPPQQPAAATTPVSPVRPMSLPSAASGAPAPAAAAPAAAAPAPVQTAARTTEGGGFAVQLAAPGSEAEARATFAALQRKYPEQLSGQTPIIRRTELAGGKTVYRLRIGPYSREDAASTCTQLQSAGGQCFIAKN